MAFITTAKDGTRRLCFRGADSNRKTVHLGKVPARWANDLRDLVESLLQHQRHDQPIPAKTSERLAALAPELQQRLAATGLIVIASERRISVSELLDTFAASREGAIKERTRENNAQAARNLRDFCGERPVDEISIRDAESFLRYLQTVPAKRGCRATLSPDTIAKHFKTARQVFETAVRDDCIGKNPFKFVKTHGGDITERQEYVTTELVLRVIGAAPSLQWQLLIAMSRFAGVRVPSEPRRLKWTDVDLTARTMRITDGKNERHAGRKYRTCPITSDLMPYFEAAAAAPREPDGFVFSPSIRNHTNLAAMMRKRLKRLGIPAWEKTWHNLRFSCYTDFVNAGIAPATVSKWLGNTDVIGLRHYHDSTSAALTHGAALSFVASPPANDSPSATVATVELKAGDVDESLAASVELHGDLSALGIIFDTADESDASIEPVTGGHTDTPKAREENHTENPTRIPTRAVPESGKMGQNDKNAESVMCPDLQRITPHSAPRKPTYRPRQDSNL